MIHFNGKPVIGFGEQLRETLRAVEAFTRTLSPREKTILKIGLAASHLEESVAHGDWTRAQAHAESVEKLFEEIRK